jgi:Holliday junction resolvasome RuvABC endonuclease subunit
MKIAGYDPASQLSGHALAVDGKPVHIDTWSPRDKQAKPVARLMDFGSWFEFWIAEHQPDMLAVEVIKVSTSHDTTRSLSRHEAVAIWIAKNAGVIILEHAVSSARKIVFGPGNGGMKKEVAFEEIKRMYPDLPWKPKTRGGMDQADAVVMALAGPALAERQ